MKHASIYASAALAATWILCSSHVGPLWCIGILLCATAAFVFAVGVAPRVRLRHIVAATLIVMGVATVATPRDSGDVYMYPMFGSVFSVHHESPYVHAPREFQDDPLLKGTVEEWRHVRSPYGPAFTLVGGAVALLANGSVTAARVMFQLMDVAVVLAAMLLVYRRSRNNRCAAFLGLNPAILAIVNGGHNDILIAGCIFAALVCCSLPRRFVVGALLGLALCLKITAIVPVAAVVVWIWFRSSRRVAIRESITAGAIALVAYIAANPLNVMHSLGDSGMITSRASLWTLPRHLGLPDGALMPATALLFVVLALTVGRRWVRNKTASGTTLRAGMCETYLYPYVLPWYAAPGLFAAALEWNWRLFAVVQVQATALLVAYAVPPGEPSAGFVGALSAVALPVSAVAVCCILYADKCAGHDKLRESCRQVAQ